MTDQAPTTEAELDEIFGAVPSVSAAADSRIADIRMHVVTLSDVTPQPVEWLWRGYLPLGKLSVIEGDPGLGKSTLTVALAAAVSRGRGLPGMPTGIPADVVFVTYEDDLADTVRPRLDAAGADCTRIHAIQGISASSTERLVRFPDDAPAVFDVVGAHGARLVIIDPLAAALSGDTDSYKDADIRRTLAPLARFAEETRTAVLVVRHLTKRGGRAITSGGGSIGIGAAARVVLAVHADPDRPDDGRVLAVVKSNLARSAPSLAFRLASQHNGCARIEWAGESPHTADHLASLRSDDAGGEEGAQQEAGDWLRGLLESGPLDRKDIERRAKDAGFAMRTVERSAGRIGVQKRAHGFGTDKRSEWSISANPAQSHHVREAVGIDEIGGNELIPDEQEIVDYVREP